MTDFAEGHGGIGFLTDQVIDGILKREAMVQLQLHVRFPFGQAYDFIVLGTGEFAWLVAVLYMRQIDDSFVVATLQVVVEGEGGDADGACLFEDV